MPVPLRQNFTYRIPEEFRERIKIGARVLVPFGKQLLTGYAVAFHPAIEPGSEMQPEEIKDIAELTDDEPLITEEILKLTQWTADYYAASWGEILKASLPAGINVSVEKMLSITDLGRHEIFRAPEDKNLKTKILSHLMEHPEASLSELAKNFGAGARREMPKLVKAGLVHLSLESREEKAKPKLQRLVKLL